MIPIFIELSRYDDNVKIYINASNILNMNTCSMGMNSSGTKIYFCSDDSPLVVREKYEDIKNMIEYKIWNTLHQKM